MHANFSLFLATITGLLLTTSCSSPSTTAPDSDGVRVTRVFDASEPGAYKHPAAITQLANGDLYLAYYGGSGEYGDDTAVYGARRDAATRRWSHPEVIADTPDRSEGNPVVWQAPDGKVWLFYVNRYGATWSTSRIKAKISVDGAHTWSDSFLLTFEEGTMVRGQPIVLADGDYLLPVYHETGDDREETGAGTTSFFLRRDARTGKWSETPRIRSATGNLQAQVVELEPGHLIGYLRRGGNYEPTDDGYLLRAESRDGGKTWTDAVPTGFPNPNAAIEFIRLQSGHLLLVYNDSMNERTPLVAALSTDGDRSYPHRLRLAGGDNTFAYPYAIQARDGTIHVICTTDHRQTILHFELEESALLAP